MALRQSAGAGYLNGFFWNSASMTVPLEGLPVMIDTAGSLGAVKQATAGAIIVGIIADAQLYQNLQPITLVGVQGQVVEVVAGAAGFSDGDLLKADTAGMVTAGSTDPYYLQAMTTTTSGNVGQARIVGGGAIVAVTGWTRSATTLYPTTDGDTIATGPAASDATGLSMVGITGAGQLSGIGTGAAVDILLTPKGAGVVKVGASDAAGIPVLTAIVGYTRAQTSAVGVITNASVTSSSKIMICGGEASANAVNVVPGAGSFTVYDTTGTGLVSKYVDYIIFAYQEVNNG